ncbi:kit ligand a [Genypterus blacodes]|uniref:kit ligand a n=1 Tax=Genypterus blacodes TaxID=154954 RepID=UPI003F76AD5C
MKKSKIWIRVCVHLLLFITLGIHSSAFDINPVTDDISKLSTLKQNIPKDYIISVQYIPKEEGGMCWVKLNVYYLEEGLKVLSDKFGNISSNRKDISIFIVMLEELRFSMGRTVEPAMSDFQCHYRKERWPTAQYFDFVKDFFIAAQQREDSDDCDPPLCPTAPYTVTGEYTPESPFTTSEVECDPSSPHCKSYNEHQRFLPEVLERSLLSLLLIPLLAVIFLLVWKVRSRRNQEDLQQNPGEGGLFTGTEGTPPLDAQISEKNKLNVIQTV